MAITREWLAPCGLYCGACGIRIAHETGDRRLQEKLAVVYGLKPEQIQCAGCLAEGDLVFSYCRVCGIKNCVKERGYESCAACADFSCAKVEQFPSPEGKQEILRAIPRWRELGTGKWVEETERRFSCPSCGARFFRGARRCRSCKNEVSSGS
jgi:hypothetical protein